MLFNNIFFNSPLAGASAPKYTIAGTVYDADGTTAVANAVVALGAYNATSAANGTYTISSIPSGTSGSMTCTLTGYSWTAITVAAMSANLTAQNYTNAWWASGGSAATCLRAYKAKGAASLAASYVNLVTPGTGDATVWASKDAPAFNTSTGWTFTSGGTTVLDTNLVATNAMSANVAYSGVTVEGNRTLFGTYHAGQVQFHIFPYIATTDSLYRAGGTYTHTSQLAAGVIGVTPASAYQNGVNVGNLASPLTGTTTYKIPISGYTADGSSVNTGTAIGCVMKAFCIHSGTLNDAQMAIFNTAMAAL